MLIIDRIMSILEERKIKNKDLCEYIGVANSTFTNWKNRKTNPPSEYIIPISEFLNLPVEFILCGEVKNIKLNDAQIELLNLSSCVSEKELYKIIGRLEYIVENNLNNE